MTMSDYQELTTIQDLIRWGASRFNEEKLVFGHGTDNAFDEALVLVCHALYLPLPFPENYFTAHVTAAERISAIGLIEKRLHSRQPAAYLTQQTRFAGLDFYVDERVLVPRSPLAEWIDQGFEPWLQPDAVQNVLDLCTGSGCIAIACAFAFEQAAVDAVELSTEALAVAEINVARHKLQDWVQLIESDLFTALGKQRYQLIISNPPYVGVAEMDDLPQEFRHEPEIGLAAGNDGLDIVVRILAEAGEYLDDDGILVVEVGNSQEALEQYFPEIPFLWLEFEHGGHGVFMLEAKQIQQYQSVFEQRSTRNVG